VENSNGLTRFCGDNAEFRQEIDRAAGLCLPGHRAMAPATYFSAGTSPAWQDWKDRIFLPHLRPALEGVREAAQQRDWKAIVRLDSHLDAALAPSGACTRSRALGRAVILGRHAPCAEKVWRRYRTLVENGDSPGHAVVAHAIRASAFFLTPHLAAGAYVYGEMACAFPSDRELWSAVEDCMAGWKTEPLRLMAA
jgi:hypothetical protein